MALSLVRGQSERLRPPRTLYVPFPFGRPLGRPGDPVYQRWVIDWAFRLLRAPRTVLVDFPEGIEDAAHRPLDVPVPEALDPADEAAALREHYDRNVARTGRTMVLRGTPPDRIPDAVAELQRYATGTPRSELTLPGHPLKWGIDITCYYEEAAAAQVEGVPEARQVERWFLDRTLAGAVFQKARAVYAAERKRTPTGS